MMPSRPLRVAALIDLPRSPQSGGHVKGWERRAHAVAQAQNPMNLDLTVFFSGPAKTEILSDAVRLVQLPPVFSTQRLRFLPYVPDHTDLAPYHPALARALESFDVIHTTDAYFAFSKTAERVARARQIPLVTSFHTDTPSYARVFTRKTIHGLFGDGFLARFLDDTCQLPERQQDKMMRRLRAHLAVCKEALVIRPEDKSEVDRIMGPEHAHPMRVVVDRSLFKPDGADRGIVESRYAVPRGRFLIVFVGRLDEGKNIYTLIDAAAALIAAGADIHLFAAGIGPAADDLRRRLKDRVTVAGFVAPADLAQVMASADLLALTSEVEIRSLVAVEAMAAGLPVLVSAKSGIADLIPAGAALQPVSGAGTAWADAIHAIMQDPDRRQRMRAAALRYADQSIASWEDIMRDDFLPVWERAAGRIGDKGADEKSKGQGASARKIG